MSMGALDERVCIVTAAGRGLGREHPLALAAEGASVVINDLGGQLDGSGADEGPAADVAAEIRAMGGRAVPSTDSAADWEGAQGMVNQAVEAFGDLHLFVNKPHGSTRLLVIWSGSNQAVARAGEGQRCTAKPSS